MTRHPLTSTLLHTVSHGAQDYSLYPRIYAVTVEDSYGQTHYRPLVSQDSTLSFLERIRLWLRLLLMGCGDVEFEDLPYEVFCHLDQSENSGFQTHHEYSWPYRACAVGPLLLRRYGYTGFVQWLYRFSLRSRIERCFLPQRRFLDAREHFAACLGVWDSQLYCPAILSPD